MSCHPTSRKQKFPIGSIALVTVELEESPQAFRLSRVPEAGFVALHQYLEMALFSPR